MKYIIQKLLILILLFLPVCLQAQTGVPYDIKVNGVKVIVQPAGNEITVIQTIIKGGVENYPASKAGIENLAISALTECGTVKDDKNSFKDKLDKVSAQISSNSDMDYAMFSMNCIKSDFEIVWPLYSDALTAPRFDAKEFARIKQDAINIIKANESNPDYAIDKMAKQNAFAGKSYAKDPGGNVETISRLTVDETKKYWKSILTRSRMLIIVVSDLEKNLIEEKVKQLLAKIPAGTPIKQVKSSYTPVANTFK
ncbi:MAG: M16 family metallopeptidase, partial [Chitinophagaceae bacterium]